MEFPTAVVSVVAVVAVAVLSTCSSRRKFHGAIHTGDRRSGLFMGSSLFVQSGRRSLHKVDVVCTKFCTKKEESWQVDFHIKTAS